MPVDSRKVVEGCISALVIHVTHHLECSWRYDTNSKTKRMFCVVASVENQKTKTEMLSTYIQGDYNFGSGSTKKEELFISSVRRELNAPFLPWVPGDGVGHLKNVFQYYSY